MKINHLLVATIMELRKIYHDRRRLLILVLGPILICMIFGYVFFYRPHDIDVTVYVDSFYNTTSTVYEESSAIIKTIDESDRFDVSQVYSLTDAFRRLSESKTRAVVVLQEGTTGLQSINITVDVTDRILQQIIQVELPQIIDSYSSQSAIKALADSGISAQQAAQVVNPVKIDIKTNEWRDIKDFDLGASGVIILFVIGICVLMSVTSITSERSSGTIERIYASPYTAFEIIGSKLISYSVLAIVVTTLIIASLRLFFGIVMGNIFLVFLVSILVGINAVSLGILVSAVTNREMESIMAGMLLWFLTMILMGYTWPLETMHPILQGFSHLTPYSYGLRAIRHINLNNWDFTQVWLDMAVVVGFTAVQIAIAIGFLRRDLG